MKRSKTIVKHSLLGFIALNLLLGTVVYGANPGSIGALFEYTPAATPNKWVLLGDYIKDGSIDSSEIENDSLTSDDLAADSVGSTELQSNSVESGHVKLDSLTALDLAINSVGQGEIQDDAVGNAELQDDIFIDMIRGINFIEGDFGVMMASSDEWLRLNSGSSTHTNGILTLGLLRADGGLRVGDDEGFYRGGEDVIDTDDNFVINARLSIGVDPNSGDDVGDRDYNDARYMNVGETGDSIGDNTIDSSEIQDETLTASDLAPNSVGNSEIVNTANFTMQDLKLTGDNYINNSAPTLYLQDVDSRSGMIRMINGSMYFLRGDGIDSTTWTPLAGRWPLIISMDTNVAYFGGDILMGSTRVISGDGWLEGDRIRQNTVDSSEIQNESLTAADLGPNSVGTSELQNNSVTSIKIVDNSVTTNDILNNTITETDISDSFVARNSSRLGGYTSSNFIRVGTSGDQLQDNTVDGSEIQNESITASDLAANSVGNSELIDSPQFYKPTAANPTSGAHVATKSYVDNRWLRGQVYGPPGGTVIASNTINTYKVINNSLTSADLGPNSVGNSELIDSPAFYKPTAANPTSGSHVATKAYVDSKSGAPLTTTYISPLRRINSGSSFRIGNQNRVMCALAENTSFDHAASSGAGNEGCYITKSGSTWTMRARGKSVKPFDCKASCFKFR